MSQRRIAIVVQRYGEEVNGGAELAARWLAENLLQLAEVHVITTCALDYTTWADHYPPGQSTLNGVQLHRFSVDAPRNWRKSRKLTGKMLYQDHTVLDELEWLKQQGPTSSSLLTYIEDNHHTYDAFIFFTYIYATTAFGLPLVADRAILVPAAHDEPYLYLPVFRPIFRLPRLLVHLTQAEKMLVKEVIDPPVPQLVASVGISAPPQADAARFRQEHGIAGDFILFAGRISQAKNVPELFAFFRRFQQEQQRPLKLVLLGQANIPIPTDPDIIHLGFVPEQDKFDAIQAAAAVVIPSLYESLSIIALEAWLMERPVLANGRCEVLKQQCLLSNGGLYYLSYDEFAAELALLLDSAALQAQLGRSGRSFVLANYHRDVIIARYRAILEAVYRS